MQVKSECNNLINKDEVLERVDFDSFYKKLVPSLKSGSNGELKGICPFHEDSNPSLSINLKSGLWHCFGGCGGGDVFSFYMRFNGVDFMTSLKELAKTQGMATRITQPKTVASFQYTDKAGKTLYVKERVEPGRDGKDKEFFFKHQENGNWVNGRGCNPVLFNLHEVSKINHIILVEGEGKVELLKEWGFTATCLDAGANSPWKDEYTKILEGKEEVIIIIDNDKPGKEYASRIANAVYGKVGIVKVVELPGLKEKEDIKNWVKIPSNDKGKLLSTIEATPVFDGEAKEKCKDNRAINIIELLEKTVHNRTINPSQDFVNGVMYYAVNVDDSPYLITSKKELISFSQAQEKGIKLKTKSADTFKFSSEGILNYYKNYKEVKVSEIYKQIYNLLGDYVFLKCDSHRKFLSVWAIGTYIFKVFRFYPYVWLNSPKQSGKTLLMEILMELCFNGDMSTNATEATIFRDVHNNSITMFLDEVETLSKKDADMYRNIISILNTGFSNSGIVKRAGSKNQNFAIQRFSTYSPKMFAGIKEIDDVVQDRTIKITMLRKKSGEIIKRYKMSDALIKTQGEIKDKLYIFGLQYAKDISALYNNYFEQLEGLEHLENRELDIWEPIFTIANVIDIENGNSELTDTLSQFSKENSSERLEDDKDLNETVKLLSVLKEMVDDNNPIPLKTDKTIRYYDTGEVFSYFKGIDEYSWMADYTKTTLTKLLKRHAKVKVKLEWSPREKKKVRTYLVDTENLKDLVERYIENTVNSNNLTI